MDGDCVPKRKSEPSVAPSSVVAHPSGLELLDHALEAGKGRAN
jgi:hypothetical protein